MSKFADTWKNNTGESVGKTAAWWTSVPLRLFVAGVAIIVIFRFVLPQVLSPLYRAACASVDQQLGAGLTCQILDWLSVGKTAIGEGLQSILPESGGGGPDTLPEFSVVEYQFEAPIQVELLGESANVYLQPNGTLIGVWTLQNNGKTITALARADTNDVTWLKIPWSTSFGWIVASGVNQTQLPTVEKLEQESLADIGPWDEIPEHLLDTGPVVESGSYEDQSALTAWNILRGQPTRGSYTLSISREELAVLEALAELGDQWQMLAKSVIAGLNTFENEWSNLRYREMNINEADNELATTVKKINGANVTVQISAIGDKGWLDIGSHSVFVVGVLTFGKNTINLQIPNNDIMIWVIRSGYSNSDIQPGLVLGGK